jgi:hypothetical protein
MGCEPIFIGGLSRCGKTLIGSLLSAHPEVAIPRKELNLWTKFYRLYGNLKYQKNLDRCLAAMLEDQSIEKLKLNIDKIRNEFDQGRKSYARLFDLFLTNYAESLGKRRWGIHSVCIDYYTDFVFSAFPTAKMIYTIRDPRDRYIEQITTRKARMGDKLAIATFNWLYSINLAQKKQRQYPQRYKIVSYEKLVSKPEEVIRNICEFLNEDYLPVESVMKNNLQYRGEKISISFIGNYHQMMSKREIAFIQAYTNEKMLAYNYELEIVKFSVFDYLLHHFAHRPLNKAIIIFWRIMKFIYRKFPLFMKYFGKSPIMYPIR